MAGHGRGSQQEEKARKECDAAVQLAVYNHLRKHGGREEKKKSCQKAIAQGMATPRGHEVLIQPPSGFNGLFSMEFIQPVCQQKRQKVGKVKEGCQDLVGSKKAEHGGSFCCRKGLCQAVNPSKIGLKFVTAGGFSSAVSGFQFTRGVDVKGRHFEGGVQVESVPALCAEQAGQAFSAQGEGAGLQGQA